MQSCDSEAFSVFNHANVRDSFYLFAPLELVKW